MASIPSEVWHQIFEFSGAKTLNAVSTQVSKLPVNVRDGFYMKFFREIYITSEPGPRKLIKLEAFNRVAVPIEIASMNEFIQSFGHFVRIVIIACVNDHERCNKTWKKLFKKQVIGEKFKEFLCDQVFELIWYCDHISCSKLVGPHSKMHFRSYICNVANNVLPDTEKIENMKCFGSEHLCEVDLSHLKNLYIYLPSPQVVNQFESRLFKLPALESLIIETHSNTIGLLSYKDWPRLTKLMFKLDTLHEFDSLRIEFPDLSLLSANLLQIDQNGATFVKSWKNLKHLSFERCNMREMSTKMEELRSIETLNLSSNSLIGIAKMEKLTSLKQLYIKNNKIMDIRPLHRLNQLKILDISGNKVKFLEHLDSMTQLQELHAERNNIHSIQMDVTKLKKLRKLNLASNKIKDISSLYALKSLESLNLHNNRIVTYDLDAFPDLLEVDLSDNPIEFLRHKKLKVELNFEQHHKFAGSNFHRY